MAGRSHVIGEHIDGSVFERWRRDPDYRPKNLVDWAEIRDIDPADIASDTPA